MAFKRDFSHFWPVITGTESARKASKQGVIACAICAGATTFMVILNLYTKTQYDFELGALLDAFLFIVIGFGIYKINRVAAVAGLILYIIERVDMWYQYGPKNPVITFLLILMFVNAVRGVFAYHEFSKVQPTEEAVLKPE